MVSWESCSQQSWSRSWCAGPQPRATPPVSVLLPLPFSLPANLPSHFRCIQPVVTPEASSAHLQLLISNHPQVCSEMLAPFPPTSSQTIFTPSAHGPLQPSSVSDATVRGSIQRLILNFLCQVPHARPLHVSSHFLTTSISEK